MSQGPHTLKGQMLERLMQAGGWLLPQVLAEGLSTSRPAIEDALADLVIEQLAEYMPAAGYRFKTTELCRQAARRLVARGGDRVVLAKPAGSAYRVAVAQRLAGDLVLYELEMPLPPEGAEHLQQHLRQVDQILKFTTQGN